MSPIENATNVQQSLLVVDPPPWMVWVIWFGVVFVFGLMLGPDEWSARGPNKLPTPDQLMTDNLMCFGILLICFVVLFGFKRYTFFPYGVAVGILFFRYKIGFFKLIPPYAKGPKPRPWWSEYVPQIISPKVTVYTESTKLKIPLYYRYAYLLPDLYTAGPASPPTTPPASPSASKTP
jgi:hypothetical protein